MRSSPCLFRCRWSRRRALVCVSPVITSRASACVGACYSGTAVPLLLPEARNVPAQTQSVTDAPPAWGPAPLSLLAAALMASCNDAAPSHHVLYVLLLADRLYFATSTWTGARVVALLGRARVNGCTGGNKRRDDREDQNVASIHFKASFWPPGERRLKCTREEGLVQYTPKSVPAEMARQ